MLACGRPEGRLAINVLPLSIEKVQLAATAQYFSTDAKTARILTEHLMIFRKIITQLTLNSYMLPLCVSFTPEFPKVVKMSKTEFGPLIPRGRLVLRTTAPKMTNNYCFKRIEGHLNKSPCKD